LAFRKSKKNKAPKTEVIEPEVIEPTTDEIIDDVIEAKPEDKTLARTDAVTQYLQQIAKYPLLSKEDEKKWAIKYYETKDPQAAEVLVTSNLRFVVKIASEYSKFGNRLIDLIQEGNVGLMQAVKDFNPYKGVRLITYAVWWIRGYIQEYLMKQYSMVKIGTTQNQRKLFYRLQKEREEMERLGFNEAVKQLSGKLDIPEGEIIEMSKRMSGKDLSLSAPVGEDGGTTLMDLQSEASEEDLEDQLGTLEEVSNLNEVIDDLREDLNERELDLLENRILSSEPMTLQEIGDKNGVTREAVRQMEARLIKKIQTKFLETQNTQ
jgi:RNA polymerase sigma-32 factor